MTQRLIATIVSLLLTAVYLTSAAFAEKRVALVIGNSSYEHVWKLANPTNDAKDVAAALKRLSFDVTLHLDQSFGTMNRVLRDFARNATRAELAVVYYAGHGIEMDKKNYLIPVDAQLRHDVDVIFEAIPLDHLMQTVQGAKGLRLILLDACRNNPFAASIAMTSSTRSIGRGLSRVEPSFGTLVSYAAREGTTAYDGGGRNSPYTKALLAHLEQPGLDVQFLFRKVRDQVLTETNGTQEPFTYGSLPGKRLYLKEPKTQEYQISKQQRERIAWNTVKDTKSPDVVRIFLANNPDGEFSAAARQKIEELDELQAAHQVALSEKAAWGFVKDSGSIRMLSNFLGLYPDGQFKKEAAAQIEALKAEAKAQREVEEEADRKAREQAAATETKAHAPVGQFLGTKRAVSEPKKKKQKTATAPKNEKRKKTGRRCGECCPNRAVCWDQFYYCGIQYESRNAAGLCDRYAAE